MTSISEKLTKVVERVNKFQESNSAAQGWDVYTQGAEKGKYTGVSASPKVGNNERTMPEVLNREVEAAFTEQGLDMGTYFRVRNTEHEAALRR